MQRVGFNTAALRSASLSTPQAAPASAPKNTSTFERIASNPGSPSILAGLLPMNGAQPAGSRRTVPAANVAMVEHLLTYIDIEAMIDSAFNMFFPRNDNDPDSVAAYNATKPAVINAVRAVTPQAVQRVAAAFDGTLLTALTHFIEQSPAHRLLLTQLPIMFEELLLAQRCELYRDRAAESLPEPLRALVDRFNQLPAPNEEAMTLLREFILSLNPEHRNEVDERALATMIAPVARHIDVATLRDAIAFFQANKDALLHAVTRLATERS